MLSNVPSYTIEVGQHSFHLANGRCYEHDIVSEAEDGAAAGRRSALPCHPIPSLAVREDFKIAELLFTDQADLMQKSLASTLALELAQADEIAKAVNVLDEISKLQAEGAVSLEQSAEVVALCNHIKLNHLFNEDFSPRYSTEQLYRSAKGEANTSSDSVDQEPVRTNSTGL